MKIAIYGCGGFAREVAPLAAELGRDVVFISDDPSEHGIVCGWPCVGLEDVPPGTGYVIAIADRDVRTRLAEKADAHGLLADSVISKTARLSGRQSIGPGAIICDFVIITDNVHVGRHFHANFYSYIGHDTRVGDFVTLAPRTGVGGNHEVGDHVYVGTCAVLRHGTPAQPLRIGARATVGMGAVVTKDVPAGLTVVGNPARPIVRDSCLPVEKHSGGAGVGGRQGVARLDQEHTRRQAG